MFSPPACRSKIFSLTLAVGVLLPAAITRAEDMRDHAESLQAVPADASFYAAWVKNAEQIEALQESNAWEKLMTIPALQMGLAQVQTFWQFPPDERLVAVKEWIESDEGEDVLELLKEMGSEEIFIYGDGAFTDLLKLFVDVNSEMTRIQFEALRQFGDPDALDNEELIKQNVVDLLRKHQDKITVPDLVIGFRIDDTDRAEELLDMAEQQLRQLAAEAPPEVAELLERETSGGVNLLTLTVTGELLPWDEIEMEMEDAPEVYELIREIAEDKQAVLAVGVVENFVVISFGDSTDHLKNLGGGSLLADTTEFDRLNRHAEEEITSIAYASGEFMQAVNSNEQSFEDIAVMAKGWLSLADLDPLRTKAIEKDIDELARDIIDYLPEPGAIAAVSFMTDRGYESFTYNWGEMPSNFDGSKPLTLVNHLGEDSIGWFVARGKQSIEGYDKFTGWMKRIFEHVEAIAETETDPHDWAEYVAVRDQVLPLLARLDKANREYLIPGMADGQGAIVFEATAADTDWCDFLPEAKNELPLPTLAIVQGVSDAGLVIQGAEEYLEVAQQVIDMAHEAEPDEIPAFQIPAPNEASAGGGTIYSYALPYEWGVNERVAPNMGLNDSVMVLSLLPELSEKLLEGSRPAVDGPAAEFDRPLVSAGHFKFAEFIELFKPWIDYGIQVAMEEQDEDAAAVVGMVGFVKPQVDQFLEVLQAIDSITWTTYEEEGAWVTHGETRIIDLED